MWWCGGGRSEGSDGEDEEEGEEEGFQESVNGVLE